jgi:hypothetical protein
MFDRQERREFVLHGAGIRTDAAVAGKFKIDGRWHRRAIGRCGADEVASLHIAGGAEGEEVVRPRLDTRPPRASPIDGEPFVDELAALGCLDVREGDAVAGDPSQSMALW